MNSYDDEFPTCLQTYATLRLFSNDIEPGEVTELLGALPTDSFVKGATYGAGHVRKFNGWFLSSQGSIDSRDARRHIDWIVSKIGNRAQEMASLQARKVEADVSCFWLSGGQGGPLLSPAQMIGLINLNLPISWDVYFANDGE